MAEKEYIEREALKETILSNKLMAREPAAKRILQMIEDTPAADVAPVVHGKWLKPEYEYHVGICSLCGCAPLKPAFRAIPYNYCPNCGAKMDGEV